MASPVATTTVGNPRNYNVQLQSFENIKTSYVDLISNPDATLEAKACFFNQQSHFPHCAQVLYDLLQENPVAFANIMFIAEQARTKAFEAFERDHKGEWIKRYFNLLLHFINPHQNAIIFCRQSMEMLPEPYRNQLSECPTNTIEIGRLGSLISIFNDKDFTENCLRTFFLANRVPGDYDALLIGLESGWEDRTTQPYGARFIFTNDFFDTWFFESFCLGFTVYSPASQRLAYNCMGTDKRVLLQSTMLELHDNDPAVIALLMKLNSDCSGSDCPSRVLYLKNFQELVPQEEARSAYELLIIELDANNRSKALPFLIVAMDEETLEDFLTTCGGFSRTNSFALLNSTEARYIAHQLSATPRKLQLLCQHLKTIIKSQSLNNTLELPWNVDETARHAATLPFQKSNPSHMEIHVMSEFVGSIPPLYLSLAGMTPEVNEVPIQRYLISSIPYLSEEQCRNFALYLCLPNIDEEIVALMKSCETITLEKYLIILSNLSPHIVNEILSTYRKFLEHKEKLIDDEGNPFLVTNELRSVLGPLSLAIPLFDKSLPSDNKPDDLPIVVSLINKFQKLFFEMNTPKIAPAVVAQKRPRTLSFEELSGIDGISLKQLEQLGYKDQKALTLVGIVSTKDFELLGIAKGNADNLATLKRYLSQPQLEKTWSEFKAKQFFSLFDIIDSTIAEPKELFNLKEVRKKFATAEELVE